MWQNVCVCLVSYKVCVHRTRVVGGLDTPASIFYLTLTISYYLWSNCRDSRRRGKITTGFVYSPWKSGFMRQHNIEMNWRVNPIRSPKVAIVSSKLSPDSGFTGVEGSRWPCDHLPPVLGQQDRVRQRWQHFEGRARFNISAIIKTLFASLHDFISGVVCYDG